MGGVLSFLALRRLATTWRVLYDGTSTMQREDCIMPIKRQPRAKNDDSSAQPGFPSSVVYKISLHPVLAEEFESEGGADWLRQVLIDRYVSRLPERQLRVVNSMLARWKSFAEAMYLLENVPDAVLTTNNRCMSEAQAIKEGLTVVTHGGLERLPARIPQSPGRAPGAGAPRLEPREPVAQDVPVPPPPQRIHRDPFTPISQVAPVSPAVRELANRLAGDDLDGGDDA